MAWNGKEEKLKIASPRKRREHRRIQGLIPSPYYPILSPAGVAALVLTTVRGGGAISVGAEWTRKKRILIRKNVRCLEEMCL